MSGRKAVVVIFGCAPTGSPMNLYPEEVFRSELRRFCSKFFFLNSMKTFLFNLTLNR